MLELVKGKVYTLVEADWKWIFEYKETLGRRGIVKAARQCCIDKDGSIDPCWTKSNGSLFTEMIQVGIGSFVTIAPLVRMFLIQDTLKLKVMRLIMIHVVLQVAYH